MKQKRYEKPFEIEAEIIANKLKARQKLAAAEKLDVEIQGILMEANAPGCGPGDRQYLTEKADDMRQKADKLRRTYELIFEVHIPQLTRTLAALKTKPMAFLEGEAVVLQK